MIIEIDDTQKRLKEIGKELSVTQLSFYNKELNLTIVIAIPFGGGDESFLMSHYGKDDPTYCNQALAPYIGRF